MSGETALGGQVDVCCFWLVEFRLWLVYEIDLFTKKAISSGDVYCC
jgi:hypothetical protein